MPLRCRRLFVTELNDALCALSAPLSPCFADALPRMPRLLIYYAVIFHAAAALLMPLRCQRHAAATLLAICMPFRR